MSRIILTSIFVTALAATAFKASWNRIFITNHACSYIDEFSTMEESKRIGALIEELAPNQSSITTHGLTLRFKEIWIDHPMRLHHRLVWIPVWTPEPEVNLSVRFHDPPFPHSDIWVECEKSDYEYFDGNDEDRFHISFSSPPALPITLQVRDSHTKEIIATVELNKKTSLRMQPES